jgi:hypothetical protein
MNITWIKATTNHATESCCLGEWKVGGIRWEDSVLAYYMFCTLPGCKLRTRYYENVGEAKKVVEREVEYWVKKAGLR